MAEDAPSLIDDPPSISIAMSRGSYVLATVLGVVMGSCAATGAVIGVVQGGVAGWSVALPALAFMGVFWWVAIWGWRTRNNRLEVLRIEREGLIAYPTRSRWTLSIPWTAVRQARLVRLNGQRLLAIEPVNFTAEMRRLPKIRRALLRLPQILTASKGIVFLREELEWKLDDLVRVISQRVAAANRE